MKHLFRNLLLIAFVVCCNFQQALVQQMPPIPIDSNVRIGVKFGENLNAYTVVDETVYNISNVPVNTPGAIDSCLLIERISKEGPSEANLNKVKEFILKKHAEDLKENSYWMGSIDEYLFTGMNPIKDYEQTVNSITAKNIQKFADNLFKQKNEAEVSMISPDKEYYRHTEVKVVTC